jgi:prepilin-type N-terminal cleavage/methylation domain-containing protein
VIRASKSRRAFTLLEILVVLAIIGLQNYVIHEQTTKAVDKRRRGAKPSETKSS